MLRPLYRCMLRLHPPGFRRRFEDEILSIFDTAVRTRDRIRLLVDAILSLSRQWILRPEFWQDAPIRSAQPAPDGVPSFYSFEAFRPRATAVIHGSVLTVTLFLATCYGIRYSWIRVLHVRIPEMQFERSVWLPETGSSSSPRPFPIMEAVKASGQISPSLRPLLSQTQTVVAPAVGETERIPEPSEEAHSKPEKSFSSTPAPVSPSATGRGVPAAEPLAETTLDPAHRHLVIEGAIKHLRHSYIDPVAAGQMAAALRRHEQNGDDSDATDGTAFADLLTNQMRQVSNDRHLAVIYSEFAMPGHQVGPTPEALARYQREMERTNCTFEKVEVLPNNIGYVKFNSFPDLSVCKSAAAAAMASLNEADAIIFDLRDNQGGLPAMVAFMESYLFEHPTHLDDLYNRAEHSTLQSWTLSPVVGNKLADKPAYVLISHSTFSAAEEFSYDMKMLKRATLVGETTAGGAHMTRPHQIDRNFSIRVPDTTPINPISKTNWEGTGVKPDVNVKTADALTTAEALAVNKLQRK